MDYTVKSPQQQAADRQDLALYSRISRDEYFDNLQLINKLEGVTTYDDVNEADRKLSSMRAFELMREPIAGQFDAAHFLAVHEYLFQDIYYFAGQYRDIGMEIDSVTVFSPSKLIPKLMTDLFNELKSDNYLKNLDKDTFCSKLADKMTMLNKIHPFREGNGRTKRIFISQLSQSAGYDINWNACDKNEWIIADQCAFDSLRDYGKADTSYLEHLLGRAVAPIASANNDQNAAPANRITGQGKLSPAFLQMVRNMPVGGVAKTPNMLDSGADMQ